MKLSIIVPVYKVEQFLDKCVESILSQTFRDFELILVDDGSPDRCGDMCDEWATRDTRIKVIHKENGGLSDARNAGIEKAEGEYIGFVDSDDYIKKDMYEVLLNNIEKFNADMSMCGYVDEYADGRRIDNSCTDVYLWDQKEAIRQVMMGKNVSVHAVVKLYRKSLFNNIRYPVRKISEDAYIIMDLLLQAQKIVFTPYSAYYYVHRENSINSSLYRQIDLTRIEAHKKNLNLIEEYYPEYRALAFQRYLGANAFVAGKMAMSGISERTNSDCKKVFQELRKNYAQIIRGSYFSSRRKASITILLTSKKLYKITMSKLNKMV